MARKTPFAGYQELDPGDSLATDGYFFQSQNPVIADFLDKIGAVTHRHDAHAAMADPTLAATLSTASSGGSIPSSTTIYVQYTLFDGQGGETLPTTVQNVVTAAGYADPNGAPSWSLSTSAGSLLTNTYLYAISVTDGLGGETALGPPVSVTVPSSANAEVTLSGLTALTDTSSGSSSSAGWRLWRSVDGGNEWNLMATGSHSTDTWTDDGTTAGDCSVDPLDVGTTGDANTLSVTVPSGQPSEATFFSIYASTDGSFTSPALLGTYPISDAGSVKTFTDLTVQSGSPPAVSRAYPGADQINPTTDIAQAGATDGQALLWNNSAGEWQPGTTADSGDLQSTSNLSDVANADTSRFNLHVPALTPAQCVATSNVSSRSGLLTIDGYTLVAGDHVLLTAQTAASQNGVWVAASGSWTRPDEFPSGSPVTARTCAVINGTTNASTQWLLAVNSSVTIDTNVQPWNQIGGGAGAGLLAANNLSDVSDEDSARYHLHIPSLSAAAAVATSNVSTLSGTPTIDGAALTAGQLVLLVAQTTASQNGLWQVASGAWTRPDEFPSGGSVGARTCAIVGGTSYADTLWLLRRNSSVVIDTGSQTWAQITGAPGSAPGGTAGGDLSGSYPNPSVATVNGHAASSVVTDSRSGGAIPFNSTGVTNGQVPVYNSTANAWEPGSGGGGTITGINSPGNALIEGQIESLTPVLERKRTQVSPTLMVATNAASALTISTPDSSGQVVEPAIEYIPWGWNGHKYWGLITGYTNGDSTTENPSLYYSDDGTTWTSAGASFFPISGYPGSSVYNADPEIVLGPDNKLHMFWLKDGQTPSTSTSLMWCTYDGTTLTTPTAILGPTVNTTEAMVAPVLYWDGANDQWVLFYTDIAHYYNATSTAYVFKRRTCSGTSPNGTWSSATTVTVNGVPSGQSIWECHLARRGEELHMVTTCCTTVNYPTGNGSATGLYFGVSDDGGLTWTLNSTPILTATGGSNWDSTLMYRGDIVPLDDASNGAYQLWYSAENSSGQWHFGRTTITRNQSVNAIDGVTVTGTPTSGQVVTATSATTANWQTPSSGGSLSQLAQAYRASALSWGSTAWQKVPIDTSVFDTGGNLDVTTNHRYNVPANGYYWVSACVLINVPSSGEADVLVGIYKNGAAVAHGGGSPSTAGSVGMLATVSRVIGCAAGDYLELWALADSGQSLLIAGGTGSYTPATAQNFLDVMKVA